MNININRAIIGNWFNNLKDNWFGCEDDFISKNQVAGTLGGAAVGGIIGYEAGKAEHARASSQVCTWKEPNTYNKFLGTTPSDYYSYSSWDYRSHNLDPNSPYFNGERIFREAPVLKNGEVQMHDITKNVSSERYNALTGTFGGIFIGGTVGFLLSTGVNLMKRIIES